MAERDDERLGIANQVRLEIGIENTLSARQARSFVRCLQTAWQVPIIQWRNQESAQELADARRLLHVAEINRQIEGSASPGAIECCRRAGEILEWLARANDRTRTVAPIELFAAAAFQLGGLPAMANGLLAQIDMEDDGTRLYGSFLSADFDDVLAAATSFWQRNALEKMSTRTFSEDASLLITLMRAVAHSYAEAFEVALLDKGIATSHGQMPQRLRRLMDELIERRICPITVATATLTEGVNLPFDIIFLTSLKRGTFDPTTNRRLVTPLSTAEFRNLAGRAGRPGASRGMEGMTLIAIPQANSVATASQQELQRRQRRELQAEYDALLANILRDERQAAAVQSPLALLLTAIAERAAAIGIDEDEFLDWLDAITPEVISADAGVGASTARARLADSVDELDGFLLTALEELTHAAVDEMDGPQAEAYLISLWQRTFANVAAVQEAWMEDAFIRRGRAIFDTVYPDGDERERLYRYGSTPYVGRRFERIAPQVKQLLANAVGYGDTDENDRLHVFEEIGQLIAADRGYGFRVRQTQTDQRLLADWTGVLAWWLQGPDAPAPDPVSLRSWQRFVADNLEFRLGTVIGAVVAQAWSTGADNPLAVPSLEDWRVTTGLPWFAFWARELLRWGTLDPFIAFALAQGLAKTRDGAAARRIEFERWLALENFNVDAENKIDPQRFLEWQRSIPRSDNDLFDEEPDAAQLVGTDGRNRRYSVIPIHSDDAINWLDQPVSSWPGM